MDARRATMDTVDGVVTGLSVDGRAVEAEWDVTTPGHVIESLCEYAHDTGAQVWLTTGTEHIPELNGTQATFEPDGTWHEGPPRSHVASLTHEIHHAIPVGEDLYRPDAPASPAHLNPSSGDADHGAAASPLEGLFPTPGEEPDPVPHASQNDGQVDVAGLFDDEPEDTPRQATGVSAHPSGSTEAVAPEDDHVPDVNALSPDELEEWVAGSVLGEEHATQGSTTIRTRTGVPSGPRPLAIAAALGVAAVCLISLTIIAVTSGGEEGTPAAESSESPLTGAYAVSAAEMTTAESAPADTPLPGFEQAWTVKVASGASVAATTHAVVVGTGGGITLRSPETGKVIGGAKVKGKVEAILSATLRNSRGGGQIPVVAWKQGRTVTVYRVDDAKTSRLSLRVPKDAEVSSRGGGLLITKGNRAGVAVLTERLIKPKETGRKSGRGSRKQRSRPIKRTSVSIDWIEDTPSDEGSADTTQTAAALAAFTDSATADRDTASATSAEDGLWAYAATPAGDAWWLNADGTAHLPTDSGTRSVEMIRPRSGLRFAGWVGGSVDVSTSSAGALIAVWVDPATDEMQLVSHDPETGEPVSAVATAMSNVQGGVSGTRSSHLSVGPYLIDGVTGKIAVDGGDDYRVVGVAGELASVRKPDGTVGVVNLGWIRPGEDLRVYPTQGRPLGAGQDGTVIFQMPGSKVTAYAASE